MYYRAKGCEKDCNAEGGLSVLARQESHDDDDRSINRHSSALNETSSGGLNTDNFDPYDPAIYARKRLSEDEKLQLLTYTWKVPSTFKFPVTSDRRFNPSWLTDRPWLHYKK